MPDLDKLAAGGRAVEKTEALEAEGLGIMGSDRWAYYNKEDADAALAERIASETELLEENARLRAMLYWVWWNFDEVFPDLDHDKWLDAISAHLTKEDSHDG